MHYVVYKLVPKRILGKKAHHQLYTTSAQMWEYANSRIDLFYATVGKRVTSREKNNVDLVVRSLQKAHRQLENLSVQAAESSNRSKVGELDFRSILKFEKDVGKWLENAESLQQKLQRQIDAERYFKRQDEEREHREQHEANHKANQRYLRSKPLPPLRKSMSMSALGSHPSRTRQTEIQGFLPSRDSDITQIIESYRTTKYNFDLDGYPKLAVHSSTWT